MQRKLVAFRLDPEIIAGLDAVKVRDGVPASEQIRRALRAWLATKGIDPVTGKPEPVRRPPSRSRKA